MNTISLMNYFKHQHYSCVLNLILANLILANIFNQSRYYYQ